MSHKRWDKFVRSLGQTLAAWPDPRPRQKLPRLAKSPVHRLTERDRDGLQTRWNPCQRLTTPLPTGLATTLRTQGPPK